MSDNAGRDAFDSAIRALESELSTSGAFLTIDATARQAYASQVAAMAAELRQQVVAGRMTWEQAAHQAQEARNVIMEVSRGRSTPVGRAVAQQLKRRGKTLNEMIAKKAAELYGPKADFSRLTGAARGRVYREVVTSAGKPNLQVTTTMRRLSKAGKGLIFVSLAISVYSVATADDKAIAAGRELVVTGAGIAGGVSGGALAGLACGPGAPICVGVGAFVGGALAAFGVDLAW